jgi:hypothetical protein
MRFAETHTGPLYELAKLVADCWSSRAILEPFAFSLTANNYQDLPGETSGGEPFPTNVIYVGRVVICLTDQGSSNQVNFRRADSPNSQLITLPFNEPTDLSAAFSSITVHGGTSVLFIGYRLTRS